MTFDQKCFDLAQSFLSDVPELDAAKLAPFLAEIIQGTIEGFIEAEQEALLGSDLTTLMEWKRIEKARQ